MDWIGLVFKTPVPYQYHCNYPILTEITNTMDVISTTFPVGSFKAKRDIHVAAKLSKVGNRPKIILRCTDTFS